MSANYFYDQQGYYHYQGTDNLWYRYPPAPPAVPAQPNQYPYYYGHTQQQQNPAATGSYQQAHSPQVLRDSPRQHLSARQQHSPRTGQPTGAPAPVQGVYPRHGGSAPANASNYPSARTWQPDGTPSVNQGYPVSGAAEPVSARHSHQGSPDSPRAQRYQDPGPAQANASNRRTPHRSRHHRQRQPRAHPNVPPLLETFVEDQRRRSRASQARRQSKGNMPVEADPIRPRSVVRPQAVPAQAVRHSSRSETSLPPAKPPRTRSRPEQRKPDGTQVRFSKTKHSTDVVVNTARHKTAEITFSVSSGPKGEKQIKVFVDYPSRNSASKLSSGSRSSSFVDVHKATEIPESSREKGKARLVDYSSSSTRG